MKSKNIEFKLFIGIGLLIALFGFLAPYFTININSNNYINLGLWVSELAGFFMLLGNGTFVKTKYFKYLKGILAFIIVGVLFKIQHLMFANVLVIIGFIGALSIYSFSFFKKPIKNRLDILKLVWCISVCFISVLRFKHTISSDYQLLSSSLMLLAIIDFFKKKK